MIHKVFPDKEKAKSILLLALEREKFLSSLKTEFSTALAENYYEIAKELATAILLLEGLKSVGENAHKEAIDALSKNGFSQDEIELLHDLRIKRNKSSYEGKPIDKSYIENKRERLSDIIQKLKSVAQLKIS